MNTELNERVIHTRVPEKLEAELKDRAAEMGVSVSNLVRNVLSNALGLVNDLVSESEQVVRAARRALRGRSPAVLGWQAAVLDRNAVCEQCNEILPRGSDASIAIVDGSALGPRPVLCAKCLEEVRRGGGR